MVERLKNPLFLAAIASVIYQIMAKYGVAPTFDEWQLWIDLLTYAIIGTGVYSKFTGIKKAP